MWIVVDEYYNKVYGTFASKEDAEEWLAAQGIPVDEYATQEIAVYPLHPITEKIAELNP